MTDARPLPTGEALPWPQFRLWHLSLLVMFVAVATREIQDQCRGEPVLVALASAGFAGYGFIGWAGWRLARRFEARLGLTPLLVLYFIAMAALFLVATVVYLVMEWGLGVGAWRFGR
jgi:hypothetical protein